MVYRVYQQLSSMAYYIDQLNATRRNSTQLNVHQLCWPSNIADGPTLILHADDHYNITEHLPEPRHFKQQLTHITSAMPGGVDVTNTAQQLIGSYLNSTPESVL